MIQIQIKQRLQGLRQYINKVDTLVQDNNFNDALRLIRKTKNSQQWKTATRYTQNDYQLDSLKRKNSLLKVQFEHLREQQLTIRQNIQSYKQGYCEGVSEDILNIFISRFEIALTDINKIQYNLARVNSNYQKICFQTIEGGLITQIEFIRVKEMQNQARCILFRAFRFTNQQVWIMIHCTNDKIIKKWVQCINYGRIISKSQNKKHLFQIDGQLRSTHQVTPQQQFENSDVFYINELNRHHNGSFQSKNGADKFLKVDNSVIEPQKGSRNRFATRKTSEHLTLKVVNAGFKSHQKNLLKYRSQRNIIQDNVSQNSVKIKNTGLTKKIQNQMDKKKKLLMRDPSNFMIKSVINPANQIKEMDDEGKSKQSQNFSMKRNIQKKQDPYLLDNSQFAQSRKISEQGSEKQYNFPVKVNYRDLKLDNISILDHSSLRQKNQSIKSSHHKSGLHGTQLNIKSPKEQNNDHQENESEDHDSSEQIGDHAAQSSKDNEQLEILAIRIQELKKGILITKCSQNGFNPHEKQLYLSENQLDLCSRDLKDKTIKKSMIKNIESVEYLKYGKGIIKHIKIVEEKRCMVIRLKIDNQMKNWEFVSKLAQPLEKFAINLNDFVERIKNL